MSQLTFDHYRPEWEDPDEPVTGPAFYWSRIREIVAHYPGCDCDNIPDGDIGEDWADFPEYMRAQQRAYLRRGYSVGYNVEGDARGHKWEGRGDTFQNAANVGRKFDYNRNDDTISYKFVVDQADGATPAAAAAFREFVAEARAAAGRFLPYRPHSYYEWTACCGDGIRAQITSGYFEPPQSPPPVSPPTTMEIPDMMWLIAKKDNDGPHFAAPRLGGPRYHVSTQCPRLYPFADNDSRRAFDIGSGKIVSTWIECEPTTEAVIAQYMGE